MAININSSIVISSQWTAYKATAITSKLLPTQYDDDGVKYTIFALDGNIAYVCTIWKGTVPADTVAQYSQGQNDSDKTDFETNYKTNANKRVAKTDGFGNPISASINYASAFGLLPNTNSGIINGYIPTVALTTVAVRATAYIQPAAAAQRSVSSSNVNDTSAGTGARTVKITYFDGSMNGPLTETITLNGTTAVATSNTNIQFIERIEVITVGSDGANDGTISLFVNNSGGGGTIGSIAISDNSTFWGHHYVPTGKTCYLLSVRCGSTITNGAITIQAAGSPLTPNLAQKNVSGSIRYGSGNQVISFYEWQIPISIQGPNFIFANTKPDAVTASTTSASFDYLEF